MYTAIDISGSQLEVTVIRGGDAILAYPITIRITPVTFESAIRMEIINEADYQNFTRRASKISI